MRDFWLSCGHHLLDRDEGGGLVVTDEFLKAYLARPELAPPADATLVTNAHIYGKLPYDPVNDFVPITGLGISPQALVVNPSVQARTVGELVELGQRSPGEINYGTFGIGTSGHLNIISCSLRA